MATPTAIDRHAELDRRLVAATRDLHVLQSVSWPTTVEHEFLAGWRAGQVRLPRVDYPRSDLAATRAELDAIIAAAEPADPVGDYLARSARSWRIAAELLEALGTHAVTALSVQLYGQPHDRLPGSTLTSLDAARQFIAVAEEVGDGAGAAETPDEIPAAVLREQLCARLDAFFGSGVVRVETDPDLIAKAAAGATRIRLRAAASFSSYDRDQLLNHEAFVHSLTALNGRAQPYLKSLARASPRITATQEGLAVFAELASGSIDITRIKRISLRILAIDMAMRGADFIEVFRHFLDAGQGDADSFASAQRVFRGVAPAGGAAFTKDAVYLHGLLAVHTFFRWALKHNRMALCRNLFAGKLSLHDVFALEAQFDAGVIAAPRHVPPWLQHARGLAGTLAFSLFSNRLHLDHVRMEDLALGA